ncbi:hypothetical protein M406DRAFT_74642 [Cryphonectria parasitica EP155]|uniref:Uncharacterized protein n=1 Tax=Cryphonectria parasitica (strain ATCC 38755 / EP155) TaxID=660469 RepID=A0A9P4XVF4_CRYP1|nr:uncharacterized protein M406DRAFT_74642 [Cryphonectria parasitica EP155]KAF3761699.1 hypothetical protein M406DRAFT_74642 [Cryphonectria parasitica EP155]
MSSNVDCSPDMALIKAADLPLPESPSTTPIIDKAKVKAVESPDQQVEQKSGHVRRVTEILKPVGLSSEDTKVPDSASDSASVGSTLTCSDCIDTTGNHAVPTIKVTQATIDEVAGGPYDKGETPLQEESTDEKQDELHAEFDPSALSADIIKDKAQSTKTVVYGSENIEDDMQTAAACDSGRDQSGDAQWVDPFDKKNNNSVVDCYFTGGGQIQALSPVEEGGCVSLKLCRTSDLYIKAKGKTGQVYIFEVDAVAIAAGSPVLSEMVFKTHTRGNQPEWVFELNDDPVALKFIFSIFHLKLCAPLFTQEPKPEQIYSVMQVLSKYQVKDEVFHAWAKTWVAGFRKGLPTTTLSPLECLHIAHRLGDFKSFKSYIRKVAHEVEVDADGVMRLGNGQVIQEAVPICGDLANNIQAVRNADLVAILACLLEAYLFLTNPANLDKQHFCKSMSHHKDCNQKLLGSLFINLVQQDLWPIPDPKSFRGKVGDLITKVRSMEIRGLYFPGLAPHEQRHGLCKLGQAEIVDKIARYEGWLPLSGEMIVAMYVTGRHIGLHKDEKSEFDDYKAVYNTAIADYEDEFPQQLWSWDECEGPVEASSMFLEEDSGVADDSTSTKDQSSLT